MSKAKQKKIEQLKDYFEKRPRVAMAFLFGSQSNNRASQRSDWDIGVYLRGKTGLVEMESEQSYAQTRDHLWADLIDLLETDKVDLVILNSAPAQIADRIIKGQPLVIKDRRLYLEFMLRVTNQAIDYRQMVEEYYDIFQRSRSLTKEDKTLLKERIMFLKNELADLEQFRDLTWQDYYQKSRPRRNVERWVENLVNSGLDIAKTILASQRQSVPNIYRKIFLHLQLLPPFSKDLAEKLAGWANLRNILAHEYLDLKWKKIKSFIKQANYWEEFLEGVEDLVEE